MLEVVITTIVDVEIHITLDARQLAHVGMLPESPFALVLHLVHIIVGYPVGIVVEDRGTEILLLKLIIGVDDGLGMILIFHDMQPRKHITLEILHILVGRLVFDVEHRRQVAIGEMHLVEKIISLFACRRLVAPEMIYATDEPKVTSLIEILTEIVVETL